MKLNNLKNLGSVIKSLRDSKGISQEQLAKLLDIPRPSVSQIENGERDTSFAEINKILEVFEISYVELIDLIKPKAKIVKPANQQKNKQIKFDKEKFKQLFLYILEKCGSKPNVGETVLYKLFYFCDFNYFEIYEKPLTGMKYRKMQYGPVPDQALFNPLLKEMRQNGAVERVSRPYLKDTIQTRYLNFTEADLSIFGSDVDKVIKVVDSVIERMAGMTARQIEDYSHRDYPWQAHQDGEEIDYGSVFFRSGEFANRDYDAMWQQASANDILAQLGEMSDDEYKYYLNLLNK